MPILILLGIGAIYGIVALKENSSAKTDYPFNGTDQQKTDWICRQNQKKIDKILRKYGGK